MKPNAHSSAGSVSPEEIRQALFTSRRPAITPLFTDDRLTRVALEPVAKPNPSLIQRVVRLFHS